MWKALLKSASSLPRVLVQQFYIFIHMAKEKFDEVDTTMTKKADGPSSSTASASVASEPVTTQPAVPETKYEDSTNISPDADVTELSAIEAKKGGHDITVSSLIHLLGIPNKDELKILDKKIDLVLSRLNSLAVKVDAMASDLSSGELSSTLARMEDQLMALRSGKEK